MLTLCSESGVTFKDRRIFPRSSTLKVSALGHLFLFSLSFPIFGIQIGSFACYAPLIFSLIDFKFHAGLWTLSWWKATRVVSFFLAVAICFIVPTLMVSYSGVEIFRFVLKLGMAFYLILYFSAAILQLGLGPLILGLVGSVALALVQFIEANFLYTDFLSLKSWFREFRVFGFSVGFPIGRDLGASYAPGMINGWSRVSGGAAEPGYFSSILIFLLPFVYLRNKKRVWAAWIIGILCSFSKVTFVQLSVLLLFPIFLVCPSLSTMATVVVSAIISRMYVDSSGGLEFVYRNFGSTVLERLRGFYLYWDLPFSAQLFGTGLNGACDFFSGSQLSLAEVPGSLINNHGRTLCTLGVHSGLASFLLSVGLIGLLLITLTLSFNFWVNHPPERRLRILCLVCFIGGVQSIYILSFYPALLANVALMLGAGRLSCRNEKFGRN